MYIPEKKLILWAGEEIKRRIPFLTDWRIIPKKERQNLTIDMLITARYKTQTYRFCIEIKRAGYPQYIREAIVRLEDFVRDNPSHYPIIVVPKLEEQAKFICKRHNVGYLDLFGNTKITYGSIFIETESKKEKKQYTQQQHITQKQSIFSPKATRITKCLLSEPHKKWLQKDIAYKTGLSKGMVSRIVRRMMEAGYLIEKDNKLILSNFDDLLTAWFEATLSRRENRKFYYVWAQNSQRLMQTISDELSRRQVKYAFTQEAAASLIAPFTTFDIVSMYIESFDKFPAHIFSATETRKGFNIVLVEAQDEAIFEDAQDIRGMKLVDNFQLYVDLKKSPLRGDKQAEHILNIIRKT